MGFLFFTFYLLWLDAKKTERSSMAIWLPVIWMFFAGTREFTQWFDLGREYSPQAFIEGNFVEQAFQLSMILAGVLILAGRRQDWGDLIARNSLIFLFFLFGAISILWSEYPLVSCKRLIKSTGTLIMALVILTEESPYEAFGDVIRRLAILVIPLSIVLCKYYPEFGRSTHHDSWTYIGMAAGKNLLGQLCLISGIYFLWHLMFPMNRRDAEESIYPGRLLSYLFLAMIAYLLYLANSATSTVCLLVAMCIFLIGRIPAVADRFKMYLAVGFLLIMLVGFLDEMFSLQEYLLYAIGRDQNLTSRYPMWKLLLSMSEDPIFGSGYESFWLGTRMNYLWVKFGGIIQSHNGYLETYLNLGLIGLIIMAANILSGFLKATEQLTENYSIAVIRLTIIIVVALYNWTEASFYGISNMFLLFFAAALDIPDYGSVEETVAS
jgi:O-antigen ligase